MDRRVAVRKSLGLALAILASAASAQNDDFNCPSQKGKLTFEEGWATAIPTDVNMSWPDGTTVDFVCAIDRAGRMVGCKFAVRPMEPAIPATIERSILRAMPRMMQYLRSDTPNQPCVASKLVLKFGETEAGP